MSFLGYYVEKPKVTRFPTFQTQSSAPRSPRSPPPTANVRWSNTFHEKPTPSETDPHDRRDETPEYYDNLRPVTDTGTYIPPNEFDEYGAELEPDARVWKTYVKESDEFDQDLVEGWNRSLDVILSKSSTIISVFLTYLDQRTLYSFCGLVLSYIHDIRTRKFQAATRRPSGRHRPNSRNHFSNIASDRSRKPVAPITIDELGRSIRERIFSKLDRRVYQHPLVPFPRTERSRIVDRHARQRMVLLIHVGVEPASRVYKQEDDNNAGTPWSCGKCQNCSCSYPRLCTCRFVSVLFSRRFKLTRIVLFAVGLSIYLWEMHFGVALPVILVTLSVMSVYLASSILPFLYEFCPYTTATSRFIKGIYDTFLRTTTINGNSIIPQDIITSRALRWLIETCEDPRSVDIALQAIAGAEETLPLEPLKECNAPLMISRRLTAGSAHTKTSEFKQVFQLYARALSCFQPSGGSAVEAKPRSCDPEELWIKVRKLQNSTERELDVHLTNQELYLTEDNLLALQIGTSAFSYCLQVLDIAPQNRSYELIDSAVELLEKTDPNELHNAARISFITGTQMLIACSLIHCESPLAARLILRLMEADLSPKYLGVFLTLFALSRNDYLGWIVPAPLDSVARATRAIDAVAYYTPILDQLDDETADTLIDFGLLELLSGSSSYNLLDRDFEQIRAMFIWVARDQGAQIHTLPEKFDIRRHAMNIISTELETLDGQQAVFKSDASVVAYLTALRQSYSTDIGSPPERIYGFVVESFFRAPSLFLEDCWGLMGDFPIPILSEGLAHVMDDREILRLLLGALDSQIPDQRIFALSQLALLIKLVTGDAKGGLIAKGWKVIIAETFRYEELCKPLEQLERIGKGLVRAFRDIYEEDQQWSYYEYCSRVVDYVS